MDRQGHAAGVHRPQHNPRVRPLHRRGAPQHRHPHVPRRRLRLGALQGGPLREAAEQDVPAQRGLLPDPVRERGGPRGDLRDVRQVQPRGRQRRGSGVLHGRHQPADSGGRDARADPRRAGDGGQVHPGRAPRRDRRLRLLAVQPRRQAQARLAGLRARHRDAEDRGPAPRAPGSRARRWGSRRWWASSRAAGGARQPRRDPPQPERGGERTTGRATGGRRRAGR